MAQKQSSLQTLGIVTGDIRSVAPNEKFATGIADDMSIDDTNMIITLIYESEEVDKKINVLLYIIDDYLNGGAEYKIQLHLFTEDANARVCPQTIQVVLSEERKLCIPGWALVHYCKLYFKSTEECKVISPEVCEIMNLIKKIKFPIVEKTIGTHYGVPPQLITDRISLANYHTHYIKVEGKNFVLTNNPNLVCLLLSLICSTYEQAYDQYQEWIGENIQVLIETVSIKFCPRAANHKLPKDIAETFISLFLMCISKGINPDYWERFIEGRLGSLKQVFRAAEPFPVKLRHDVIKNITDQIRAVPNLSKFLGKCFLGENPLMPQELAKHVRGLVEYKEMSQYKIVKDFLEEEISLAHIKRIKSDQLKFFQNFQNIVEQKKEPKHIFFTDPEIILSSKNYADLTRLALTCFSFSTASFNNFGMRKLDTGLQEIKREYEIKLATLTSPAAVLKRLGIRPEQLQVVNDLLARHNESPIEEEDFKKVILD